MTITNTMSREERREAIRATEANRDHLVAIHQRNSSPAETVAELIGRIGWKAARETIAESVNARGEWDGRISDAARIWAATIGTAADGETLRAHYLTTDAIHPAHVDQLARAAAEYDADKPDCDTYDARRLRWRLLRAIGRDDQDRALDACLDAHEAARCKAIREDQRRDMGRIYDAWERGWCALEASEAATEPANAPAEAAEPATGIETPAEEEKPAEAVKTAEEWNKESERVQAATAIALAKVIAPEEATPAGERAPEYLCEKWPTSNEQPDVWYSIEYTMQDGSGPYYFQARSVDDLQSKIEQLRGMNRTVLAGWRHDRSTGERRAFFLETRREQTDRENRERCKRIAEDLEQYVNGELYRCPECGEVCTIEETENDDGDTVYKTSCGCVLEYEPEQLGLYDYFEDCLDIEYRCGSDKEYRSACIMVTCGGPNIYIDTATKQVELYWWGDRASYPISYDAAAAVDEWAEEYWGCLQ